MDNPERWLVGRLIYLYYYKTWVWLLYSCPSSVYAIPIARSLEGYFGSGVLLERTSWTKYFLVGWQWFMVECVVWLDWASSLMTRCSLTAYFVLLGSSPFSWETNKQQTVPQFSAKAEYRSIATVSCELKGFKGLLQWLGLTHDEPMCLHCDSHAALHLAVKLVFHEWTKHIEVNCHFIHDEVQRDKIAISMFELRIS